jgi:hypothetical protein
MVDPGNRIRRGAGMETVEEYFIQAAKCDPKLTGARIRAESPAEDVRIPYPEAN